MTTPTTKKPSPSPEQQRVISYRGGPLQVVACAGSGKTESISRRVAELIKEGASPESIIAFTFTDRAAVELRERIYGHVQDAMGEGYLGKLGPMFVGTIHGYCFRLLQDYVPKYGNYDVLDEHRHLGFLSREYQHLGLNSLGARHWAPIKDFSKVADVIANELIDPKELAGTEIGKCYTKYLQTLEQFRFLTFGLIVSKAVDALQDPKVLNRVHTPLRHLIVDEYQDINPAQQKLIKILAADPVQLCVVGDDDQAIYQWRGSDISNILSFASAYPNVKTFNLETNRRSRPQIIEAANEFSKSIPARLSKTMTPTRESEKPEVVCWKAETDEDEAEQIAETIQALRKKGFRYQDIGLLFRSVRTSAPTLIEVFEKYGIPYQCGGRTGLFLQPEINFLGEMFAWIVDGNWKDERFGQQRPADLDNIVAGLNKHFSKTKEGIPGLKKYLEDWKSYRLNYRKTVSLVEDYYKILNFLGIAKINPDSPEGSTRLGALARFSRILADFEHVTRRGRYVEEGGRTVFRGGQDRGKPYFQRLYNYLLNYARDSYEDFEGEQNLDVDAVSVLTVHQAKGLEWPIVFLPALTSKRFPSFLSGRVQSWHLPETIFLPKTQKRYEGGDSEERRLFYVALTRARDTVYLSHFEKMQKSAKPSPYLTEVAALCGGIKSYPKLPLPAVTGATKPKEPPALEVSFSDIATYEDCAYRYRLSSGFDFQLELAVELGYGKAIHHVLRQLAEKARGEKKVPTKTEGAVVVDEEFYLPFADNPTFERMHAAARRIVQLYLSKYSKDLGCVWAVERSFQAHLEDGIISGKADIILDHQEGHPDKLAIVDYKAANDPVRDKRYALQLAVYAAAGRGEGLDVTAGYLHDLKDCNRNSVDITPETTEKALAQLQESVAGIRRGAFPAKPETKRCEKCDFKRICISNIAPIED